MVGMSAVGGMDEAIGFFFTVGSNAHMPRCFARPPRCTAYRRLPKDIFYSVLSCSNCDWQTETGGIWLWLWTMNFSQCEENFRDGRVSWRNFSLYSWLFSSIFLPHNKLYILALRPTNSRGGWNRSRTSSFPGLCDFSWSRGVVRFKVTGIKMIDRFAHVAVEVGCLNVAAQRVRIGE